MKNLKKMMFVMAAAALTQTSCNAGEPGKLHIIGQLSGTNDSVKVIVVDAQKEQNGEKYYSETVKAEGGKFDVSVPLTQATDVIVRNIKDGRPTGQLQICGMPGEECSITGEWRGEYFVNGSQFYQQFNAMDQALSPIQREATQLVTECQERLQKGEAQDAVMAYYNSKAGDIQQRLNDAQTAFIKNNPKNEACATLIAELPAEKAKEALDMLDSSVRSGRMKPIIDQTMQRVEKELQRMEAAKKVAEGNAAPDFTLNDINGKPLALSSLRGKYVVLDFWGSWCGWCIKGFPEMKNYYNKYKGKFEILGVDCGDTEAKWKEAVKKHELPWLHVFNPRGEGDITATYAIQGYPTKIVIDPQGNIAKVVVGEDPAFYTYLDSLFAQ